MGNNNGRDRYDQIHLDLQKDPRFKIANKEALIGVALVIFNFIWWYGFAYGLGSKPVEEYTYVFGFPAWFFYSSVLGTVLMMVLVAVIVKLFMKEVSFEDPDEEHPQDNQDTSEEGSE